MREYAVEDLFADTGYLEPADVSGHLQSLDAYLFMDHRIWTKSGTIMAALEHGVPVIAFNDRREDRQFRHGENVYVVDPNDPDGLARALRDMLTKPAFRRKVGEAGKRLYDTSFSWPVIARTFLPLLSA